MTNEATQAANDTGVSKAGAQRASTKAEVLADLKALQSKLEELTHMPAEAIAWAKQHLEHVAVWVKSKV